MNPNQPLAPETSEELPWLAFLYISEEMSPADVVDFEERLMTDQAAREAVAQAMKMSEGLWMAVAMDSANLKPDANPAPVSEPAVSSPPTRRRSRFGIWVGSTVVAAGLAFCVGWWFAPQTAPPSRLPQDLAHTSSRESSNKSPASTTEIDGAEQLLEIWTDSESLLAEWEPGPAVESPSTSFGPQEDQEAEEDAFAWMMVAVSADSAAPSSDEPAVMEN